MKITNKILSIFLAVLSIVLAIVTKNISYLSYLLFLIIPFIFKINSLITFIYIIYTFLTMFLGTIYGLFRITTWYDDFTHFLWGVLSGLLGIYILDKFKMFDKNKLWFNILFIFIFSLGFSGLWEIFEYGVDNIFNTDMQRVETGVLDTMNDFIISLMGNLIFIVSFWYEYSGNKKLLIKKSQEMW